MQDKDIFKESELIPYQQQLELFYAYKNNNDIEAYKKLMSCHLRLAYKIADSYDCEKLREDLRSEAVVALGFAIERWDPSRGVLTTIATPIIRQRLARFLIENSHAARIPYLVYRDFSKAEEKPRNVQSIINARYLSNKNDAEDGHLIVESQIVDDISNNEELDAIQQLLSSIHPGYKSLLELLYGIGTHYDDKVSMELLSRMLHISKNRLKTQVTRIKEYITETPRCKSCGRVFFKRNKRTIYCDKCHKLDSDSDLSSEDVGGVFLR